MNSYHQARWDEPLVFEMNRKGRMGFSLPQLGLHEEIPPSVSREEPPQLPSLSEVEVIRHFTRLSEMSIGVETAFYPLGSCTMKHNPRVNEILASSPKVSCIHPDQNPQTIQGSLRLLYELSRFLAEITGTYSVTLQPVAGAQGEFTGCLIMRAYHRHNSSYRDEMIVPDSAHGTNPSSAAMAGFRVVVIPSGDDGCINLEALKSAVSNRTAGLMMTNPNTLGLFEENISSVAEIIHDAGGLMYYDGANLNAILGKSRPGEMGFDVLHINLHKTFSTPHGGGGPGSGPVGVQEELDRFLPIPVIESNGTNYFFDYDRPLSIGKVHGYYGNFGILVRAYSYILQMGAGGLVRASELAVLNSNYLARKISAIKGFGLPFDLGRPRKHECVISCAKLKQDTGIGASDVAKWMMDHGIHPPTVYFPLIVEEALMIEPTESERMEELDRMVMILQDLSDEAYRNPQAILVHPTNTSRGRIDEVKASHPRTMCFSWRMKQKSV